jgi:biotin carboxylase
MGESQTRFFRDKLAMRGRASQSGIPVPAFVPLVNDERVREFLAHIRPPWILKPRLMAGTIGIRKLHHPDEVWTTADGLGDQRSFYLLEQFIEGDIFHVDSAVWNGRIVRATASRYGTPPFVVSHGGGVFTTRLVERGSADDRALQPLNASVLSAFGLHEGVSHTEYIRAADGTWYFLETSARVGGAHIADLIEQATGANLWAEWAKIEAAAARGAEYSAPEDRGDYAGLIVSLARQERPDTSAYVDPEIVWRLAKHHHVGLIVRSRDHRRVEELLDRYAVRFLEDFSAAMPMRQSPTE